MNSKQFLFIYFYIAEKIGFSPEPNTRTDGRTNISRYRVVSLLSLGILKVYIFGNLNMFGTILLAVLNFQEIFELPIFQNQTIINKRVGQKGKYTEKIIKCYCLMIKSYQFYYATTVSGEASLELKRQYGNGTTSNLWALQHSDIPAQKLIPGSGVTQWFYAQIFVPPIPSESAVLFEGIQLMLKRIFS